MASDPFYPFGLPGINHLGATGQGNPLTASLDLMRQAMSSFGQSASLASGTMAQSLNPEDLERRISELKVVENWLKLNLSMLSGSIQGMEVQLATIKTLRSFVEMGSQPLSEDGQQPSPLEVVLGIRRPSTESPPVSPRPAPAPQTRPEPDTSSTGSTPQASSAGGSESADSGEGAPGIPGAPNMPEGSQAAAQAWWDMLQNQFSQIAAATTQAAQFGKPGEVDPQAAPEAEAKPRARKKVVGKSASRSASGSGSSTTGRSRKSSASRTDKNTKN